MNTNINYIYILFSILLCSEPIEESLGNQRDWEDFGIGYLFQGEAESSISNSGRIIDWDMNPAGGWKGYTYIPAISFMIGLPGKTSEGAIHPWSLRPSFYNPDTLVYWGPTVSESYIDRSTDHLYSNFTPLEGYNYSGITAGTAYGYVLDYVDNNNPYKLLATSNLPYSWAIDDNGNFFWPGWLSPDGDFFSEQDIYLQFSDKDWLYLEDDEQNYNVQGYPTNIKVEMIASSYSREELEDVIIFRARLTNESQYDYTNLYTGFYLDADVLSGDLYGYLSSVHTNADDMLNFNEELNIVYCYDYDGESGGGEYPGYVGLMYIEDSQDNGLTGFRYFDWYNRPGVPERQSSGNCCTGDVGRPVAEDMEAIQYALLSNNFEYPNQNISDWEWRDIESGPNPKQSDYNDWYFHADPNTGIIDPNFDSIESIYYSDEYLEGDNGMDVTTFLSSGPYDINQTEFIEIAFALVFGEDEEDLLNNAQFIIDNPILNIEDEQPKTARLNLNYPNPFNPSTTISFDVTKYEFVSIKIYDLKGNLLDNLSENYFRPGTHKVNWNAKHNSSGKYIIKLETNNYTESQIITLIK